MTLKKMLTEIDEKKPVVWFVEKFNLCEQNEISEKNECLALRLWVFISLLNLPNVVALHRHKCWLAVSRRLIPSWLSLNVANQKVSQFNACDNVKARKKYQKIDSMKLTEGFDELRRIPTANYKLLHSLEYIRNCNLLFMSCGVFLMI